MYCYLYKNKKIKTVYKVILIVYIVYTNLNEQTKVYVLMDKLNFKDFSTQVEKQFNSMVADADATLVRSNIDIDQIWEAYLNAYPAEFNGIFRERRTYECNHCKNFIRRIGSVVAIKNGKLISVWDVKVPGYFQQVADTLSQLVKERPICSYYLTTEKVAGHLSNFDTIDPSIKWDHFFAKVPEQYVLSGTDFGTKKSELDGHFNVFSGGMQNLTLDAAETVLELIEQGSLYRGEEHKEKVKKFIASKKKYDSLDDSQKTLFLWSEAYRLGFASRFKNEVIGTLVADLSEGKDLEVAVRSFETKVAPQNYQRPSSLITPKMIKEAQDKIESLGLTSALERRFAKETDININDILFRAKNKIALNVFDELTAESKSKPKELKKVETISLDKFVSDVMPSAESIEVLFENKMKSNLFSLIAPAHDTADNLFTWKNNFSWAYNGDLTDAIKERVKTAGGAVEGDLRVSLSWHNADDLDLHCRTPNGKIYYGRRNVDGGHLDIDMNGMDRHDSENPVENIIFANKNNMLNGRYTFIVDQYNRRSNSNIGFSIQVEFDGIIQTFELDKNVTTTAFDVILKDGKFTLENVHNTLTGETTSAPGSEVWNIKTKEFVPVKMIMNSPNHWNNESIGNKHLFFVLENCRNDESSRGFFNEYLKSDLKVHRKVFEILGSKMKAEPTNDQVSGLGFSSTVRNEITVRVTNKTQRVFKINI